MPDNAVLKCADLVNTNINENSHTCSEYSYEEHHHPPSKVDPKEFLHGEMLGNEKMELNRKITSQYP